MTNTMTDVTFHDDSFDFDPNNVAAQGSNDQGSRDGGFAQQPDAPLPMPGHYTIKLIAAGVKRDRNTGELLRDKADRPIFQIGRVAVMEPEENASVGSFQVWQDIYTNGFQPKNWKTGESLPGPKTFPFIEMLRAIDETLPTADFNENVQELAKQLAAKPTMTVRLGYYATDIDYAKAQIAQGVDKKTAYKSAEIPAKAFKNTDGTYRQATTGPSGNLVQAKVKITAWIPSGKVAGTEMGPYKSRG